MSIQGKGKQAGFSLTEALVSFAVVTGGLLAVASFQAGLFSNSAYNKARTEALSLAQEKIEEFRHYTNADPNNYIDDNADGVMDADGNYQEAPVTGNNASYVRSWDISTDGDGKRLTVTVSWVDAANDAQSVSLASSLTYLSPRSGADQLSAIAQPVIASPTGRAELVDGYLSDYPSNDIALVEGPGDDGLSTYQHADDLFLVDSDNKVLLRLRDACSSTTGVCTEFVKISGTVYLDLTNMTGNTELQAPDVLIIASDSAYCERWSDSGSLVTPSATPNGDYEYFNYACYFGGGWFGNIGFLTAPGLKQTDKICQGDPTSLNAWAQPVIALRRAYRGVLQQTKADGSIEFSSHGIKDATQLTGQDFVFTYLPADRTLGAECVGANGPMTRPDSAGGKLFADVPVDFVCLNDDADGDQLPDYLDSYDAATFTADVGCPYDPTDPPVLSHLVGGTINVVSAGTPDLSAFEVVTTDGANNCSLVSPFAAGTDGFSAKYACTVWDWGLGWTGAIQVRPNSTDIYCPSDTASFTGLTGDQAQNFSCASLNTISISGSLIYLDSNTPVTAMSIVDVFTENAGICEFNDSAYRCEIPYKLLSTDLALKVMTEGYVCGSSENTLSFFGYSKDGSPYASDILIANNASVCPLIVTDPPVVTDPVL